MGLPARRDLRLDALGWLVVVLLAQSGFDRWVQTSTIRTIDYFTLWSVPRAVGRVPDADIYARDGEAALAAALRRDIAAGLTSPAAREVMSISDELYGGRLDVTGSPLAYAAVGLLSTGNYDADVRTFVAASFAAFAVSIVLLGRLLHLSPTGIALALAAYGLCFAPVAADVRVANVNQLQLLALSAFIWLRTRGHSASAGVLLGISIMFKPNTAMVLVVLSMLAVIDRRGRSLGRIALGTAAGAVAGFAISALYFRSWSIWARFGASIGRTLGTSYPIEHGNFGLSALTNVALGLQVSVLLAIVTTMIVAGVLRASTTAGGAPRDAHPDGTDEHFLVVGAGCAVMLLSSHLVWLHYYVLLIPLSLYLLRPGMMAPEASRRVSAVAAGVALLLFSSAAQGMTTEPIEAAWLTNAATLLLFGGAMHAWWSLRTSSVAPLRATSARRAR